MARQRKSKLADSPEKDILAGAYQAIAMFSGQIECERQNVGGMYNASGSFVRFGNPGDADIKGTIIKGVNKGKAIGIECKKAGFDPRRLTSERDIIHFNRQVERLEKINKNLGFGWWINDPIQILTVIPRIIEGGWRIEFDGDKFPWMTTE